MSDSQLNLPLFTSRKGASTPATDAADLLDYLRGRGWTAGSEIARHFRWNERRVRGAAEAADGEILSGPGSPGYILTRSASADDREAIVRGLRSQARRMIRRSLVIARVHHAAR